MEKRFLSIRQAAVYSSLSPRLLYELVARREIRSFKIHRRIVLQLKDLDDFIEQNARDSVDWDEKVKDLGR